MNVFNSFWMAGFECSDQMNAFGNRVDLLQLTGHIEKIEEDYTLLGELNIKTVREGIRWSHVERTPYDYNWSDVLIIMKAAKQMDIQVIWDLCHFGYPDDLTPLHPMFARRFSRLCAAFTQMFRHNFPDDILIVTPINEASFISWLGGDVKGTVPYCTNYGWQVKYELAKAYIEGIEAIKQIDPSAQILSTEPLVNIASDFTSPELEEACQIKNNEQYQVMDMLTGRICPELGGREDLVDIMGINYYFNNQWLYPSHRFMCWKTRDYNNGWRSLHQLVKNTYFRYRKPFIIAETSHPEDERPLWYQYIGEEIENILRDNLPLLGTCVYPVIDRPDWDFPQRWHHSGVWDILNPVTQERVLHKPTFQALKEVQFNTRKIKEQTNVFVNQ